MDSDIDNWTVRGLPGPSMCSRGARDSGTRICLLQTLSSTRVASIEHRRKGLGPRTEYICLSPHETLENTAPPSPLLRMPTKDPWDFCCRKNRNNGGDNL